jgi:hypothetical protein
MAERLGKRHGVPYLIVSLSVEQHGASQPLSPAQTAVLMAAEGVYVLAMLGEHPDLIPTSRPATARRLARQVSRRLRSPEGERSSVFFAHGLFALAAASAREARDDGTALVTAVGREELSEHYPLGSVDRDHLTALEGVFTRPVVGTTAPDLAYAAPVFVGRAAAYGLGILFRRSRNRRGGHRPRPRKGAVRKTDVSVRRVVPILGETADRASSADHGANVELRRSALRLVLSDITFANSVVEGGAGGGP